MDKPNAVRKDWGDHSIRISDIPDWMAKEFVETLNGAIFAEVNGGDPDYKRIEFAAALAADLQELTKQLPVPYLSDVDLDEEEIKVNELKAIFDDVQKGES